MESTSHIYFEYLILMDISGNRDLLAKVWGSKAAATFIKVLLRRVLSLSSCALNDAKAAGGYGQPGLKRANPVTLVAEVWRFLVLQGKLVALKYKWANPLFGEIRKTS